MALWKPYADGVASDVSKLQVQEAEHHPPQYPEHYPAQLSVPFYPRYGEYYGALVTSPGGSVSANHSAASEYAAFAVPLPPPATLPPPERPDDLSDDPEFQAFEANALAAMAEKNGGVLVGSNPRMRRCVRASTAGADADAAYRHQRERNNLAAKQSRDRRKHREIHKSLQVSYLQRQVAALKAELKKRPCVRCNQSLN